uniref:Uncharacterized protein n=1 Tax=Arundo donax TaxID=35708 RepID=A0A0A9FZT0_ARUDO
MKPGQQDETISTAQRIVCPSNVVFSGTGCHRSRRGDRFRWIRYQYDATRVSFHGQLRPLHPLRQGLHPHVRQEEPHVGKVLPALAQALGVQVPFAPSGREAEHLHPHALDHSPHLILPLLAKIHELLGEHPSFLNKTT